jgi:hypothetical protein
LPVAVVVPLIWQVGVVLVVLEIYHQYQLLRENMSSRLVLAVMAQGKIVLPTLEQLQDKEQTLVSEA